MKQEPVAWMYQVNNCYTFFDTAEPPDDAYDEGTCIPLYTAPKELSDEEIIKLLNGIEYSQAEIETSFDYEIRIARAIEAKVRGEK